MSNLFSGLEKMGLGQLKNMDLYESDEKKDTGKSVKEETHITEEDIIFDKSYKCPVCDSDFKSKAVKTGKTKILSIDTDLRPKYQNVDSLKYDSIVCNHCGYAALSRYFNYITTPQSKMIATQISPNFKGVDDKADIYTYDEAILRHQLALVNSIVKKSRASEKGYICLKLAWLNRGKAETLPADTPDLDKTRSELQKEEQSFIEKAYEGFASALSKEPFPICGMDEWTFLYVTADLARKSGEYQASMKLISEIILSRKANEKIKDRARNLKELIKEDINKQK